MDSPFPWPGGEHALKGTKRHGFRVKLVKLLYSLANNGSRPVGNEVLISNYPLKSVV